MSGTENGTGSGTGFDREFDVVVVGSGAAGMSTAMGALDEGLSVLILESTGKWGGNTSMSGGGGCGCRTTR